MNKYGIKEVMDVIFYDMLSGKPVFYFDTLKVSNLDNEASSVSATGGKNNRRLLTWDHSRTASLPIQDALISMESLSMLAGSNQALKGSAVHYERVFINGADAVGAIVAEASDDAILEITNVPTADGNLTLTLGGENPLIIPVLDTQDEEDVALAISQAINNAVNSEFTANATGAEVTIQTSRYDDPATTLNVNGTGVLFTLVGFANGVAPSGGTITVDAKETLRPDSVWYRNGVTGEVTKLNGPNISGQQITINNPASQGELFYERVIQNASTVIFSADRFPGYYKVVGSTFFRSEATGRDEVAQFIIDKAKLQPGFSFNLSAEGEPSVFDFNLDVETLPNTTEMYRIVKE